MFMLLTSSTGMALMSMCIQMVQSQAKDMARWVGEELGLVEDQLRPRIKYRRSTPGTVPVTRFPERARYSATRSGRRRKRSAMKSAAEEERRRREKELEMRGGEGEGGFMSVVQQEEVSLGREEGKMGLEVDETTGMKDIKGNPEGCKTEKEEAEEKERLIEEELDLERGKNGEMGEVRQLKNETEVDTLIEEEMSRRLSKN